MISKCFLNLSNAVIWQLRNQQSKNFDVKEDLTLQEINSAAETWNSYIDL